MSNLPKTTNNFNTPAFFNGYYKTNLPVNGQQYDAVLTFFLKRTSGNKVAAEALTASVITIAQNRGINPLSVVDEFKNYKDNDSFKAALLALLNSERRTTSKLGYSVIPEANPYIVRNIGK
jgi:hypothetical protein